MNELNKHGMKGMIGDSQNPIRRRYGTIVKRLDGVIQQHSSIHPHTVSIHERTVAVASTHHTHTAPLTDVDVDTRCISLTQWPNRPRRTSCTTPPPKCLSKHRNALLYRTSERKRLSCHARSLPSTPSTRPPVAVPLQSLRTTHARG